MIHMLLLLAVGLALVSAVPTGNVTAQECDRGAELIPHPLSCQRYTNCSKQEDTHFSRYLHRHEEECPYPQLFDIRDLTCKDFKLAECGPNRVASKEPCDYVRNLCGGAHCEPCHSRLPSCVGLADGVHAHPTKLWSPYYMVCDSERTIKVAFCPRHSATDSMSMFSPTKNECVSRWEIPAAQGGSEPSCQDVEVGLYRVANKPDVYYSCPGPLVRYCGVGSEFNEVKKVCENLSTTSQSTPTDLRH